MFLPKLMSGRIKGDRLTTDRNAGHLWNVREELEGALEQSNRSSKLKPYQGPSWGASQPTY